MNLLQFRRRNRKQRLNVTISAYLCMILLLCAFFGTWNYFSQQQLEPDSISNRKLLSGSGSCEENEIKQWIKNGGFLLYLIGIVFLFIGIAIVCDDYFVAGCESISEKLNLSPDVAGATFMAAGSSAPELFSSLLSMAKPGTSSEIGIGTIVGSAVFNILVIIGAAAVFSGKILKIDWKAVTRDCFFYAASVVSVILVFITGNKIYWWEGLIFVILYASYIVFMKYNETIMKIVDSKFGNAGIAPVNDVQMAESGDEKIKEKEGDAIEQRDYLEGQAPDCLTQIQDEEQAKLIHQGSQVSIEEEETLLSTLLPPKDKNVLNMLFYCIKLPWLIAFGLTIPNCQMKKFQKYYILTFMVSIIWIGVISYFMVEWAQRVGCLFKIPPTILGVTILAAGTSIPDALSSISVARDGRGDMAIANAVGSNIFDIWFGLGFPWFVVLLIRPYIDPDKYKNYEIVDTNNGLVIDSIILFSILCAYIGTLVVAKWQMSPKVGYVFFFLYFLYCLYQIVFVWSLKIYSE